MTKLPTNTNTRRGFLALSILMIMALAMAAWLPGASAAGEADTDGSKTVNLDGTNWELLSINGADIIDGSQITAEFTEGQMGGTAGVNRYFASYEVDGAALTIGPAGSTMMMGPEDLMQQEMVFLAALGTAESFQIEGDTLQIVYSDGHLTFAVTE
jgi:heat shock protein HslJ